MRIISTSAASSRFSQKYIHGFRYVEFYHNIHSLTIENNSFLITI